MLCHVLECSFVILLRVMVLLCCGLSFGIAMPAYNRTWGYVHLFIMFSLFSVRFNIVLMWLALLMTRVVYLLIMFLRVCCCVL